MSVLQCGRFRLDLSQPRVMAIINLTDDSFSGDWKVDSEPFERVRRYMARDRSACAKVPVGP